MHTRIATCLAVTGRQSSHRVRSRPARRAGVIVASSLLALGAAAAGGVAGASSSKKLLQQVHSAYSDTEAKTTATFTLTESLSSTPATGATSTTAATSTQVTGSGVVDFTTRSFQVTLHGPAGTTEVVVTGGMAYVRPPPQMAYPGQVAAGKTWVSVNLTQLDQANLTLSSQLTPLVSDNPVQAVNELSFVSTTVTKVASTATVDGSKTTEYKATVELTKVATKTTLNGNPLQAQAASEEEAALNSTTLPVDVWVSSTKMVRQLRSDAPVLSAAGADAGRATVTLTFTNFGKPVTITAPPATLVTPIS